MTNLTEFIESVRNNTTIQTYVWQYKGGFAVDEAILTMPDVRHLNFCDNWLEKKLICNNQSLARTEYTIGLSYVASTNCEPIQDIRDDFECIYLELKKMYGSRLREGNRYSSINENTKRAFVSTTFYFIA